MVWGYFTKRPWSNSTLQRRGLCSLAENSLQYTRITWLEAALCLLGAPNHNSLILCTSGQMPPIGADIKIHHPPTVALDLFLHSEKTFKQTFSDVTSHGCLNVSFSFVFFSGFFFDFGGAGPEAGGGDDFTSASSATSIISSFTCDRADDCGFLFAKKQKQENQVFSIQHIWPQYLWLEDLGDVECKEHSCSQDQRQKYQFHTLQLFSAFQMQAGEDNWWRIKVFSSFALPLSEDRIQRHLGQILC